MKAFVLAEPGVTAWKEVAKPILEPRGAILTPVAFTPCTSDVNTVFGNGSRKPADLVLGHECIAKVIEIGSEVCDFNVGDLVAVPAITPDWRHPDVQEGNDRHAGAHFSGNKLSRSMPGVMAEFFSVQDADTTLAHIPEGVSLEAALMCVDVVTTGFTGAEAAEIKIGDSVCVFGIGAIGLMAIQGAKLRGAGRIIAIGTRGASVELAKEYGATDILNYKECDVVEEVLRMTNGIGVDAVILAGGGDTVFTQAVDMVKYGTGIISNIKHYGGDGYLMFPKFSGGRGMAGKTIKTELAKGGRRRMERLLEMVKYERIHPEKLITHHMYGLDKAGDALMLMKNKPDDLIKVMVHV